MDTGTGGYFIYVPITKGTTIFKKSTAHITLSIIDILLYIIVIELVLFYSYFLYIYTCSLEEKAGFAHKIIQLDKNR